MEIRPITNDGEHEDAVRKIDEVLQSCLKSASSSEVDAMLTLVEAYERKRWPQDGSLDPVDLLKYSMTEVGRTRSELVEIVGSASRVSEILGRKRALTLEMIRAISDAWGIPLKLLSRPYHLAGRSHRSARMRKDALADR